jgi:MtN3 and saliva related transmembrane protein
MPFLATTATLPQTARDEIEAVRARDLRRSVHRKDHGGNEMTPDTIQILGAAATLYGLGGALSVLLQARRMLVRGTSGDVSARFFAVYVGGFAVWLLYGLGVGDVPIIVVHAVGLLCGTVTLAVTLRLRRPVAQDAAVRSAGEDEAQRLPIQPRPREPEYRAQTVGDRVRARWDDQAHAARDVAEEICV